MDCAGIVILRKFFEFVLYEMAKLPHFVDRVALREKEEQPEIDFAGRRTRQEVDLKRTHELGDSVVLTRRRCTKTEPLVPKSQINLRRCFYVSKVFIRGFRFSYFFFFQEVFFVVGVDEDSSWWTYQVFGGVE